jgi:hypothetical protein
MIDFIKYLLCRHVWKFARNIYGDEIIYRGYKRSEWHCTKCRGREFRNALRSDE